MSTLRPSYVYFLKPVGCCGPIKIGHSQEPVVRLRAFLAWSPVPLELIVSVPSHRGAEAWAHKKFASCRRHSEWFDATPELLAFVAYAKRHGALDGYAYLPAFSTVLLEKRQFPLGNLIPFLKSKSIRPTDLAAAMGYAPATLRYWTNDCACHSRAGAVASALARLGVECSASDLAKPGA